VTGLVRFLVVVEHAAVGSPAAPWHSRTVTVAEPPEDLNVLTMVVSQMRPRPGVSSTPLLQVTVGAIVAAEAVDVPINRPDARSPETARPTRRELRWRRIATPVRVGRRGQ
jgi:hypothetical protein